MSASGCLISLWDLSLVVVIGGTWVLLLCLLWRQSRPASFSLFSNPSQQQQQRFYRNSRLQPAAGTESPIRYLDG